MALGCAKDAKTPISAIELFLDERIISQIVKFKNKKIQSLRAQFSEQSLKSPGIVSQMKMSYEHSMDYVTCAEYYVCLNKM